MWPTLSMAASLPEVLEASEYSAVLLAWVGLQRVQLQTPGSAIGLLIFRVVCEEKNVSCLATDRDP